MDIKVGTASWTDKTLIACGRFYPREAKTPEARLRYYASQFPLVEVDSSYYAMPSPSTAQLWVERTPEDFVFNLKAFRLFTGHQTSPTVLHKDIQHSLRGIPQQVFYYRELPSQIIDELWRRFIDALAPLRAAGKLGAVLFQFARRMAGHTVAVEFRNRSWFDGEHAQSTLAFERALGMAHVIVDGPQGFDNSVPALWEVTRPDLAMLRLHGRNAASWNTKRLTASSGRFNYDYSEEELAALVPKVLQTAEQVKRMHVVYNNNMEDQMQRNGRTMMRLLTRQQA